MPMQDTPETEASPTALPKRTTPTWEMELLLSGATVFTASTAATSGQGCTAGSSAPSAAAM